MFIILDICKQYKQLIVQVTKEKKIVLETWKSVAEVIPYTWRFSTFTCCTFVLQNIHLDELRHISSIYNNKKLDLHQVVIFIFIHINIIFTLLIVYNFNMYHITNCLI